VTGLVHDFRYGVRTLRRAPWFTALAVLVLSVGIGAGTAIFSLLDATLLRPLPFRAPDELVMLWERAPRYAHNRVSPLNFLDWSEQQHSFSAFAAIAGGGRTLTRPGELPERIPGQAVTAQFFDVFGIRPIAGRTFTADDVRIRAKVLVVSERLWRARFGSDPALVGATLTLDDESMVVVGVVPAGFRILYPADIWTLYVPRRSPEQRKPHYLQVVGRLRPGVALEQARSDLAAIADGIADASPETNRGWSVTIEPLRHAVVGADLRTTTIVLGGVVGLILLIACANVGNLLLARGLARSREIALRFAIGGSRARILRQLLVETLLVAAMGGGAGLTLAWLLIRSASSTVPADTLPQSIVLTFDLRVAAISALLTVITAALAGTAPALQASKASHAERLGSGGRTSTRAGARLRSGLVVGEIAAAVLVLTVAGLLVRSLAAMSAVDPGFRAAGVLTGSIGLPFSGYDDVNRLLAFYADAERELGRIPGVTSVGLGGSLPLDGWDIGMGFHIVGDTPGDPANGPSAHYQIVSAGYFRTLGIDLIRGRPFTGRDTLRAPPVCIVSEEFVRRYIGERQPIGMHVSVQSMDLSGGPRPVVREIVGVARQVAEGAGEREPGVQIYVPMTQNPWFTASIALRTGGSPLGLAGPMKAAIARVDRNQAVTRIRTMEEVAAAALAQPRFRAQIVGVFAALALLLSVVGIFAVLTYSVGQRLREFGIRIALGARDRDVIQLVLRGAAGMAGAGLAVGVALAAALSRFLETLLYRVEPLDPATFAAAAGMLAAAVLAAGAVPVWHATTVDPAASLRDE
jgi:putative ABC transport system permease protein